MTKKEFAKAIEISSLIESVKHSLDDIESKRNKRGPVGYIHWSQLLSNLDDKSKRDVLSFVALKLSEIKIDLEDELSKLGIEEE